MPAGVGFFEPLVTCRYHGNIISNSLTFSGWRIPHNLRDLIVSIHSKYKKDSCLSQLTLYSQFNMRKPHFVSSDIDDVASHLAADQVRFEQWELRHRADECLENEVEVFSLYHKEIERIKSELNFAHAELIAICNSDKSSISLRDRSLSEHIHDEAEARFFLCGKALIYVHLNERIHIVECNAGDFIVIPPKIPHWFDMGPKPKYACLRWFTSREGTHKQFTGSYMAESTPRWEAILGE